MDPLDLIEARTSSRRRSYNRTRASENTISAINARSRRPIRVVTSMLSGSYSLGRIKHGRAVFFRGEAGPRTLPVKKPAGPVPPRLLYWWGGGIEPAWLSPPAFKAGVYQFPPVSFIRRRQI
jgi:hypothetical protein